MSHDIDSFTGLGFSKLIADSEQEYEDVGVVRPDERLSEAYPGQFALYCERFVDFFPKSNYHVKSTYNDSGSFTGWYRKRTKKPNANGKRAPLQLIDRGDWLNRTSTVERHLDHEQWRLFHDHHQIGVGRPTEFFWLAQQMPAQTKFHAIDADNKSRIGWYGEGTPEFPLLPVMEMPFEHFVNLKKLYDAFPNRIWCITSETLGLDIIERHRLQPSSLVHTRTKQRLARISLGHTEVHPMSGRCKRRPFGEHYRTITSDSVLTTWQNQLEHYLNPEETPSFRKIATTLLSALEDQWSSWINDRHHKRNHGTDVNAEVARQREVARQVMDWLDDDCPPPTRTTEQVTATVLDVERGSREVANFATRSMTTSDFELSRLRGGRWAVALEQIARNGLPAEDTVGLVALEMAKWLWWVELFDLPQDERHDRVLGLLTTFVTEKHNGFVTRIANGQVDAVLSQISRCFDSAIALNNESSLKTFQNLRHKRTAGTYRRLILLEPIILGQTESVTTSSSLLSTIFSVPTFGDNLTIPLPDKLIQQIKQKAGRRKIDGFMTKFVNLLYFARQDNKFLYLPRKELSDRKIIPASPNKFDQHVRILVQTDVIDKETYRAKTRATGYRLRKEARQLIDDDRRNKNMPSEGV